MKSQESELYTCLGILFTPANIIDFKLNTGFYQRKYSICNHTRVDEVPKDNTSVSETYNMYFIFDFVLLDYIIFKPVHLRLPFFCKAFTYRVST